MALVGTDVFDRVRSLCVGAPFSLIEAPEPFSFERVPASVADRAFRVEVATTRAIAWGHYAEERFDRVTVWSVTHLTATPTETYRTLTTLAHSLTAAITRDGAGAGDYCVEDDGREASVQTPDSGGLAVLRLTLPVSYMAQL